MDFIGRCGLLRRFTKILYVKTKESVPLRVGGGAVLGMPPRSANDIQCHLILIRNKMLTGGDLNLQPLILHLTHCTTCPQMANGCIKMLPIMLQMEAN